jgi:hypothetical protein
VKRGGAGEVIATVELAKDMEEGAEIFSRLELVDLGTDPDSDRITSLVVQPAEATAKAERKVTGTKKVALDILRKAIDEAGVAPPASNHIPQNAGTTLIEPGAPMPTKEPSPIATSRTRENERLHALLKGSKRQI